MRTHWGIGMRDLISSDTNVWIDFGAIDAVELPFRLPFTYIMWTDALNDEVRSPKGLRGKLLSAGLLPVQVTVEEFFLADSYGDRYAGLSVYDTVALAIAKSREIVLMTGDGRPRRAASKEGVEVMGTIGVLDRLLSSGLLTHDEYRACISLLLNANGGIVRLPQDELQRRLLS